MLSILSSPKPFTGIVQTLQLNALRSWLEICSDNEVILYGESEGASAIAQELNIKHIAHIQTNEYGTPLFNAIANHAKENAKYDFQVYINSDIILTPDFMSTLQQINSPQFLMIGQRFDLHEDVTWNYADKNWHVQLKNLSDLGKISLHAPSGSDYFAYKRGLWDDLPSITIGRGGYDNALIKYVLENRFPVIDATRSVQAIHQFHDYGHMASGRQEVFEGPEALKNREFAGHHGVPSLTDATWAIDNNHYYRNFSRGDWMRFLECQCRFVYKSELLGFVCRQLRRILHRLGLSKQRDLRQKDLLNALTAIF